MRICIAKILCLQYNLVRAKSLPLHGKFIVGKSQKRNRKKNNTAFLFELTKRSTLFLFLLTGSLSALYISGNYQSFLDSTQRFLLTVCSITAIMLALFCAAGIILCIIMFAVQRLWHYWAYFLLYIIIIAAVAVLFAAMRIILALSKGL